MQPQKVSDQELMQIAKQGIQKLKQIQQNSNWEQFGEKPCTMLKMSIEGRLASRGEAVVNYPIQTVLQFLLVEANLQKLNRELLEIKVLYELKQFQGKFAPRVNFMKYSAPWPVAQRDLVSIGSTSDEGDTKYIAITACNYPYQSQKGVVRAKCHIGGYILKKIDENSTLVIYISDVDIAGMIPAMIKNKVSLSQGAVASRIQKNIRLQKQGNS